MVALERGMGMASGQGDRGVVIQQQLTVTDSPLTLGPLASFLGYHPTHLRFLRGCGREWAGQQEASCELAPT